MTEALNSSHFPQARDDGDAARAACLERFFRHRQATEALTEDLSPEDQVVQSMEDASPAKWHLAHTTWFFEEFILTKFAPAYRPFDPDYFFLFNSYYEGAGPRHARPRRGMLTRPGVGEVAAYRLHVTSVMVTLISDTDAATWQAVAPLIELGLHHEQQHQELLLTDLLHAFSLQSPEARLPAPAAGRRRRRAGRAGLDRLRGRHRRDRPCRRRLRLRQRGPAPRGPCCGPPPRFAPGDQCRVARVHCRGRLRDSDPLALRRLGHGAEGRLAGARLLGRARRRMAEHDPRRPAARRARRPRLPRQLLRGRGLRPLGRPAPAPGSGVGGRRGRTARSKATCATPAICAPCPQPRRQACSSSTARSGNGPRAPTRPTPASGPPRARSANTTASSCATSGSCAAAPASARPTTSGPATANFFYPHQRWQFSGLRLAEDA